MQTETYTINLGITIPGHRQYESIKVSVSETGTLQGKELADISAKNDAWKKLRMSTKAKLLEATADAREAVAMTRMDK